MDTKVMAKPLGLAPHYWLYAMGALAGLYLLGLYQAEAVGYIAGQAGLDLTLLHELFHDVRHAAGIMCH